MVRMGLARSRALSFAKAISIGLRSGLLGGRNKSQAPRLRMACSAAGLLWAGRLSRMTIIALLQRWDELGAGLEDRAVHRRIDDPRRGQGAAAQSRDEGLGLPMAEGGLGAKALAALAASARPGHLCVGSGFVDEDQPMQFGPHLGLPFSLPRLARLAHVGPIAFANSLKLLGAPDRPLPSEGSDLALTVIASSCDVLRITMKLLADLLTTAASFARVCLSLLATR